MSLPDLPLVVLDTETTGFLPKVNRVIEYAHVVVRNGKVESEYEELVGIDEEIPDIVRVLTRINQKDIAGKPHFETLREPILKHMGDDTLVVGQNVGFDLRMLRGEGLDLTERPWIDTSMLASLVFPELESYSLGYVSRILGLDHTPVHRALGDVHATLQLLEKCWERILELPADHRSDLIEIFGKSSAGYRMLAAAIPPASKKKTPGWLTIPRHEPVSATHATLPITKPQIGTPELIEEPLDPAFLQSIVNASAQDESTVHWIGVKNLTATLRHLHIPEGVRVLQPPFLLLNPESVDTLSAQQTLTSDEATLLLKLRWFDSPVQSDLLVHGDEKSVWAGKLACTDTSPAYVKQFIKLPSVILLDHRQLLGILADPDHAAHGALNDEAHIIIDDASMLEDTATKAYGHYADLQELRAAAEGDAAMTKLTDLLQLWIEKTRSTQDIRYLTPNDLAAAEVRAMCGQLKTLLARDVLPPQTKRLLNAVEHCLEPSAADRITWIETRQDGSQFLQSVPPSVALLLKEHLYARFSTTLLIPPRSSSMLPEIVPPGMRTKLNTDIPLRQKDVPIAFPEELSAKEVICDPPAGKSIVLAGSRRIIEQYFVQYTADLEERGVTLICQNMSGGVSRMQAEFLAAKPPVVWVLTPWTFETVDLPEGTADYLVIDALPFDHPAHAIISRRSERFRDAFSEYSMPRLLHRLFRIVRTFRELSTKDATIDVLDKRIREKRYGKTVQAYLQIVCGGAMTEAKKKKATANGDYPENWQMNLF